MKKGPRGINLASKPSGDGCVECLASPKGWWLHLRRCAECGHIGCCDSSPSQHASKHAAATGHPIIASFEPGEDWFFNYEKQGMIKGAELLPPPVLCRVDAGMLYNERPTSSLFSGTTSPVVRN